MLARLEGRASFEDGERISAREALDQALSVQGTDPSARVRISGDSGTKTLDVPAAMAVVGLRNLIENALKYSPPTEPVEVEIKETGGATVYRVRDRGAGMSDVEIAAALQRFWRREHRCEGVGLGLPLVKAIADRFGGKLELQRKEGGGLLAEFVLPHAP
jgi:signal transduction histidine kinase